MPFIEAKKRENHPQVSNGIGGLDSSIEAFKKASAEYNEVEIEYKALLDALEKAGGNVDELLLAEEDPDENAPPPHDQELGRDSSDLFYGYGYDDDERNLDF